MFFSIAFDIIRMPQFPFLSNILLVEISGGRPSLSLVLTISIGWSERFDEPF